MLIRDSKMNRGPLKRVKLDYHKYQEYLVLERKRTNTRIEGVSAVQETQSSLAPVTHKSERKEEILSTLRISILFLAVT